MRLCSRPWLIVALLTVPAAARAQEFTKDERFVVWTEYTTDEGSEDPADSQDPRKIFKAWTAHVLDVCTGKEVGAYLTHLEGPDNQGLRKKLGKKKDYDAWRAAHPLAPQACSVLSPDRREMAFLMRQGGECSFDPNPSTTTLGEPGPVEGLNACELATKLGFRESGFYVRSGMLVVQSVSHDQMAGFGPMDFSNMEVSPCWSPGGHWVGWSQRGIAMRNSGEAFAVGPGIGPQVRYELRANPELMSGRVAEIVKLLERHNQQPIRTGVADTRREQSVIYVRKGHEDEAAVLACLVPGGATTAPLDWKTDVDVVMALGSSAAGK
jgi:hypothetical protein